MLLIDYIDMKYFLISLCIGLFLTYISTPPPQIIYKYPTPDNSDDLVYIVDLDWEDGIMDIEFGVKGCGIHDTTNHNVQYKLLNTISHITRKIAKKCGMQFHTVVFKSSNWRNGKEDSGSSDIRNRFFSRYVIKEYPNAIVRNGENNSIIINLNDE